MEPIGIYDLSDLDPLLLGIVFGLIILFMIIFGIYLAVANYWKKDDENIDEY